MNNEEIIKYLEEGFNEPLKEGQERKIIFWLDREIVRIEKKLIP